MCSTSSFLLYIGCFAYMTCINAEATPTNDTGNSYHIEAVELIEPSFGNNHLPIKKSFAQVSSKDPKKFCTFWDFKVARKLAMPQNKIDHKRFSQGGF